MRAAFQWRPVIEDVQDAGEMIVVRARTEDGVVACPGCGTPTTRVHGYHSGRSLMCPLTAAGCWCG